MRFEVGLVPGVKYLELVFNSGTDADPNVPYMKVDSSVSYMKVIVCCKYLLNNLFLADQYK